MPLQLKLRTRKNLSMCLDLLLKNDFTDFYAQNAFYKKSEMFGWDFRLYKMNSRYNVYYFQSRSQNKRYFGF